MRRRQRVHLARCDYCGRKIAWSCKRRQWLVLAPFTDMPGTHLRRRLMCPSKPNGTFHDPRANILDRAFALIGGEA